MPTDILPTNSDIGTFKVGFLLLEKFTLMPLSSATEPLRMANHLTGKRLYDWQLIGESADTVSTSGGIRLLPDTTIDDSPDFDLIIVVAGINVKENTHPKTVKWLASIARKTPLMGGICTAPLVLAKAGLLDGYSCSAHWECLAALQEEHPLVYCNNHLFTFDRGRLTSTGGDVPAAHDDSPGRQPARPCDWQRHFRHVCLRQSKGQSGAPAVKDGTTDIRQSA